jgi:hypothetical protein
MKKNSPRVAYSSRPIDDFARAAIHRHARQTQGVDTDGPRPALRRKP